MNTEVRNEAGELVGWIDSVAPEGSPLAADSSGRPGMYRRPTTSHPWIATPDQLSKLRTTSLFRPLITREMMVEAASIALVRSLGIPHVDKPDEVVEAAVEAVLASLVEPLEPRQYIAPADGTRGDRIL